MTTATQDKADALDISIEALNAMYSFLDALHISGETNMYGAGIYLEREFGLGRRLASKVLSAWMEDYR